MLLFSLNKYRLGSCEIEMQHDVDQDMGKDTS